MRKIRKSILPYILKPAANLLLVAVAVAVIAGFYPCPVYYFTHIPCPGCGMTRACKSVLRLDFKAAFNYHHLFPIPFAWVAYEILRRIFKFGKKTDVIFYSFTCSALFIRWLIIMILKY